MTGVAGRSGRKPSPKLWADAISIASNDIDVNSKKKKLRLMAEKLVQMALDGDVAAMKEVGDRLDGKSRQQMTLTGENDGPVQFQQVVRQIVDPNN